MEEKKPIHAKPSYYAIMFEPLKKIALKYGYNLVLHGSLNRDMDLIAVPWIEEVGCIDEMLQEFCDYTGGRLHKWGEWIGEKRIEHEYTLKPHGRRAYIIDIYRGGYFEGDGFEKLTFFQDPQTYIDISVLQTTNNNTL